jgi:hypothetical protein
VVLGRWAEERLLPPGIAKCPFANLPEARSDRWGEA